MPVTSALRVHRDTGVFRSLKSETGLHDFSSNDYLGLAGHPIIRQRLIEALSDGCPLGATGSRLLTGQTAYHEEVETFLADLFHVESALIFNSGYLANLAAITTFGSLSADFFSDEFNHASLIDGMRLTKSKRWVYAHNDLDDLRQKLKTSFAPLKVIVTESVFSQDGDLAALSDLREMALEFDAWLVVDEAHATGVFGQRGLSLTESTDSLERLISIHTGGKALGGQGAFVLSSQEFRHLLINRARSFIFSTALSPLNTLQLKFALEEVVSDTVSRDKLRYNQKCFSDLLAIPRTLAASPIYPIILASNEKVVMAQKKLHSLGFDVRAIRSPSVKRGTERLRVSLKSFHDETLVAALAHAVNKLEHSA